MQMIDLDGAKWSGIVDFYAALFEGIGAPSWQGYSIGAAIDTIVWHNDITIVKPPYTVVVTNVPKIEYLITEINLIRECILAARQEHLARQGVDVVVSLEIS